MGMSRLAIPVFMIICLLATSGCIRKYRQSVGVNGRLIDGASEKPIGEAPITVTLHDIHGDHRFKMVSSHDGCFDQEPQYQSVWWFVGDWAEIPPIVEVLAEGYEPFKAHGCLGGPVKKGDYPVKGGYLQLGDLRLRKQQAASSPEKSP
ncbi:MAG: hypothetical protein ABSH10_02150 [Phycisphaerae bacterium]|jgi:hypothetical protein